MKNIESTNATEWFIDAQKEEKNERKVIILPWQQCGEENFHYRLQIEAIFVVYPYPLNVEAVFRLVFNNIGPIQIKGFKSNQTKF